MELAPCLYNIDEMGKDLLSDHKIISKEELKCEAEKCLKVKQRKSSLLYHGIVYGETQFKEPPKVPLKRIDVSLKKHLEQAQLRNYDPTLWESLPMKYFCYVKHAMLKFEKETVSKLNPPRENVFSNSSIEDNVKRIARNRLSKEFKTFVNGVNLLLNYFEKGLTEFVKTQFESAISESHSHVYENEICEQNSSLENENRHLKMIISQLQKDFSKMEAQSIAFKIALQHKI
ncbi:hypothetical protein Tco_0421766 [Tanacetum coccineum]